MSPDSFQQAWQAQSSRTRVTVDADLLLNEVQRNQRDFRSTILRRDVLEISVGLLLLPYWFYQGATKSLPWTWYLTVPAILWMIGFFLVDRIRHPQTPSDPAEPLLKCVKDSLTQVEHQIWLLRNVFWWYLLPFTISFSAFSIHVSLRGAIETNDWSAGLFAATLSLVIISALDYFIYRLNQYAVDSQLEPRRQELLTLLASLGEKSLAENRTMSCAQFDESSSMFRRRFLATVSCLAILIAIALATGIFEASYNNPPRSSGPASDPLARLIADERTAKNLVGLAAMVMIDGKVTAAAAHGERKIRSGVPIEITDQWHLGGVTKSITATMIARLIEAGHMEWSDTVGKIYPDAAVHDDWKRVTLSQLLTDTAGAPPNFPKELQNDRPALGPERTAARQAAVRNVIAQPSEFPRGERFAYSNVGYTIAGAMAEVATGLTWEDLVKREVFEPLALAGAGFGPPKSGDETLEQPRGHVTYLGKKYSVNDERDNTPIMGPSGIVRMTLENLCTFASDQLAGDRGTGKLLSAETYKRLHTLELGVYACGWLRKEPSAEIPFTVYWHNGSNTLWYVLLVLIPERNMVVAVTANDGDSEQAEAAAWEIVKASAAYPKKSPFAAVRWQEFQPEVKIGQEWFTLVSIDGIAAADIVAFSRRTYWETWRKRVEEDLFEVLTRMGHEPKDTVQLVVRPLGSETPQTLKDVPMTEANRQAIRDATLAREPNNK